MLNRSITFAEPYPVYHAWRKNHPVYQEEDGTWYLTRYADVKLLLSDARFSRRPPQHSGFIHQKKGKSALDDVISQWPLFNDPPQHTKLREFLTTLFTPRFIKETRTIIEPIVDSVLIPMLNHKTIDFMHAFAYPLPIKMMNQLLGTSLDIVTAREWSLHIIHAMNRGSPEDFQTITPAVLAMQNYFHELILTQEQEKKSGWLHQLIHLRHNYQINLKDLASICIFLFFAGYETVQLTLGLGLMTLLKNPEQARLLQGNTELIPAAIEEILRFESPINKLGRWTREKIMIHNTLIPENQLVVGLLNAANRDPDVFENPDEFNIHRANNRHLAFGVGIHHCLGALLARIELQAAFTQLIPYLHRFTLIEEQTTWLPNTSFRYLFKLMIAIQ